MGLTMLDGGLQFFLSGAVASIAADPTPFNALLASRNGRRPVVQVYVEGLPDVLCTETPAGGDSKATGYSVDLDGTNDYLATGNITDLTPDGDFTLLLWFKPDAWTGGGFVTPLWSWSDNPKTKGYDLSIDDSAGNAVRIYSRTTTQQTSTLGASLSKWQCLVLSQGGFYGMETRVLLVTFNDDGSIYSTQREYMSGYSGATGPTRAQRNSDSAALTATMEFGKIRTSANYFNGKLGQFAFFTRSMTASEMERAVYRIFDAKWTGFWDYLTAQILFSEGSGSRARNSASTGATYDVTTFANGAAWSATQPYTITYRPYMTAISSVGQDLEARATRTAISGISFTVLDTAGGWLTAYLKRAGRAVRRKSAYVFLGFDEILEEDYELVMNGAVESVDPLRSRGYEIRIGDAVRFARTSIQLGSTTLSTTITNASTTIEVASLYNFGARTTAKGLSGASAGGYFRIDDEIVSYDGVQASPVAFTNCLRGRFGTAAAAHTAGAQIKEVFADLNVNPIDFMLKLLMSSAGGLTTHATYDTFTRYTADNGSTLDGRGAAVALADIDLTEILDVQADHYSTYLGDFLILDSIDDLKDWTEENILRSLGAFYYTRTDGRLAIGTWHTPSTTGATTIATADQAQPEPAVDYSKIINAIEVRYDLNPITGEYGFREIFEEINSGRDHGATPVLRIDSPWLRTNGIQSGSAFSPTPGAIATALKTLLFARFKDPQDIVSTAVSLAKWQQEMAAGVVYEHEEMPDLQQGFRGLQGEAVQIIGRALDVKRARVALKLLRAPV